MKRRTLLKGALATGITAATGTRFVLAASSPDLRAVDAVTLSGDRVSLSAADVKGLAAALRGPVVQAHHPSYDAARALWNAMFDRYPALIVQPTSPEDVAAAVQFAAAHNLLTAVCCGRHSFSGKSAVDKGMMIDLGFMNEVRVDAANHIAHTQGGARLGHVDMATLQHNLITVVGTDSDTGAGGLTLGGGLGRLAPKWGLTIDNLQSAQLVMADGRILECSADENPDLFWAIRGGGGNFGVVTRFDYRLHEFNPQVYGGDVVFAWKDRHALLKLCGEMATTVPDELHLGPFVFTHPEHGPLIGIEACWCGNHAEGARVLAAITESIKPLMGEFGPTPYMGMQATANPDQRVSHYMKSGYINALDDGVIEAIADHYAADPGVIIFFQHLGGAVGRVGQTDTAFYHRNALYSVGIAAAFPDPHDYTRYRDLVRGQWEHVVPHTQGFYINFNEESQQANEANYVANRRRLAEVKAKYDPGNLFRMNANIKPV
jgi:hypothetical protein